MSGQIFVQYMEALHISPRDQKLSVLHANVPIMGSSLTPVTSRFDIEKVLTAAGDGARAIVIGLNTQKQAGHAFNAIFKEGRVFFVDGQSESVASFDYGFDKLYYIFTGK
jgi:hypothetical protein